MSKLCIVNCFVHSARIINPCCNVSMFFVVAPVAPHLVTYNLLPRNSSDLTSEIGATAGFAPQSQRCELQRAYPWSMEVKVHPLLFANPELIFRLDSGALHSLTSIKPRSGSFEGCGTSFSTSGPVPWRVSPVCSIAFFIF